VLVDLRGCFVASTLAENPPSEETTVAAIRGSLIGSICSQPGPSPA